MTYTSSNTATGTGTATGAANGGIMSWLRRAEAFLDARGKAVWVITMVLAMIFVWPVGLALLAYMIWGKQMFRGSCGHSRPDSRQWSRANPSTSGNTAFDTYKAEMLTRLEEEQRAFESFLQRLRAAKDKSEFDAFMEDRARAAAADPDQSPDQTPGQSGGQSGGQSLAPSSEPPGQEGRAGAY